MNQNEKRIFLIEALLSEGKRRDVEIPTDTDGQKRLLRSLMNVRPPLPVSEELSAAQDEYLQEEIREKGVTDIADLSPAADGIYVWQGDITTLKCDAVVNAANSKMLGCFFPCHGCIDNAIHTFAGMQLRAACNEIMLKQGFDEPVGKAKITKAYNLPCRYVLHTVGPFVGGALTAEEEGALASCYRSCLELASERRLNSLAFCCISTGEFHFPNERAAEIAVGTVREYKARTNDKIEVIFNVFKDGDYAVYKRILGAD